MPQNISNRLIIAISSRALFDLDASNAIFEKEGVDAYREYQIAHEEEILAPGRAFPLVKKLLGLNKYGELVEVILLSRNTSDTGVRVFNSIKHYGLNITRAAFTGGASRHQYAKAFGAHLFLSTNPEDVKAALKEGLAAATLFATNNHANDAPELRIAFDGDVVLFSDEAEKIYQKHGLEAFITSETAAAKTPLSAGPFKDFLTAIHKIQNQFTPETCPIRTALITARSAPTHERVINTLQSWGVRLDEALFLGGLSKEEFLRSFRADIFFDDQNCHCEGASRHVTTGHVPHGVTNNQE